jgi:hypothetical protein
MGLCFLLFVYIRIVKRVGWNYVNQVNHAMLFVLVPSQDQAFQRHMFVSSGSAIVMMNNGLLEAITI